MKIIAIETATESCSAALLINSELIQKLSLEPRQHSQLILPMIDELLAEAELKLTDLDGFAFSCGPGSFTGVRIACGVAQGITFGANLPAIPISTLQTLAQGIYRQYQKTAVISALDARMNEIYWGEYRLNHNQIMTLENQELIIKPQQASFPTESDWVGAGSGWQTETNLTEYANQQKKLNTIYPDAICYAQDVVLLAKQALIQGEYCKAEDINPIYLRQKVAKKAQNPIVF